MNIRHLKGWLLVMTGLFVPGSYALTLGEFNQICVSFQRNCSEHPVVQAYVGGALDLLATLNEREMLVTQPYCKSPDQLFDVAAIVAFLQNRPSIEGRDNAMLGVIRYFENNGGCNDEP